MFVATTLALSLVFSPVTALTQAAGPAASAKASEPAAAKPGSKPAGPGGCAKLDYRARVDVDAAALGADGQGVAPRLRTKAEQELQRNDIMSAADGADAPVVHVKLVPLPGEDGGFSFTIDITHTDQNPIKDGSSVGECPLCTESELLEKIVGATRALAPKLRAYVADYNNKPCGPAPTPVCDADADCKDPAAPKCSRQLKQCVAADECAADADCVGNTNGPACHPVIKKCVPRKDVPKATDGGGWNGKQKAGVALMVVGVVGAGVGVGLVAKKPVTPDPFMAWETRSTRNPGIAMLAVGGAVLVTGVIVYALGRRQAKATQVTPVAGPGMYGLSWSGRF